jgi:hypothetical protein
MNVLHEVAQRLALLALGQAWTVLGRSVNLKRKKICVADILNRLHMVYTPVKYLFAVESGIVFKNLFSQMFEKTFREKLRSTARKQLKTLDTPLKQHFCQTIDPECLEKRLKI